MIKTSGITKVLFSEVWVFKLYVCGENPKSAKAYFNLKKICDKWLVNNYKIELVDLYKNPELAISDNIVSCPTVVKEFPSPKRTLIGDLSKINLVVSRLDFPDPSLLSDFAKGAKSVSLSKFSDHLCQVFDLRSTAKFMPYLNLIGNQ
jgi:circadian clock protein KaiB